jgi:hypothetical protein
MRKSSSFEERIVGLSALDHGPEHGDASACEGDERLGVVFALAPLAVVERLGERVLSTDGAEGALVEDSLRALSPP